MNIRAKIFGVLSPLLFIVGNTYGEVNSMDKKFKLSHSEIERLVPEIGFAYATDLITVEGKKVDYMVRQQPEREGDSGWMFYGGGETQEYIDDPNNTSLFSVNTIANYDPEIVKFLTYPPGTEIERNSKGKLHVISQDTKEPDVILFHPVDEGTVQVTQFWSLDVATRMLRRFDKGSLVIWRPEFTIWLNAYSPKDLDVEKRAKRLIDSISPENEDFESVTTDGIRKIRYRIEEVIDGKKQESINILGLTKTQEIHMSIYYDNPSYLPEIQKIWDTLECKCT